MGHLLLGMLLRRVQTVTSSLGVSLYPACRGTDHYIFQVFSEFETLLVHYLLSFLDQIRTNLFILYILYMGHLLLGMLLLVQDAGHLMSGISLTLDPASRVVIMGLCMSSTVIYVQIQTNLFI